MSTTAGKAEALAREDVPSLLDVEPNDLGCRVGAEEESDCGCRESHEDTSFSPRIHFGLRSQRSPNFVVAAVKIVRSDRSAEVASVFEDVVFKSSRNTIITPKSVAQKKYLDAMRDCDIVFGIGPAGTGKTFLAMAMAVGFLLRKEVKRIVLARPAVEAGEKLGFLPGDMAEKVNPYLRPLHDALYTMLEYEQAGRMMERGVIEVAPLAFMRGRTLNDSFVILDEAQNTTTEQMKMFLTRIGFGSKAVITGDITQTDLPTGRISGLNEALSILKDVEGIRFCWFTEIDVVRHPMVQEIIKAYERYEKRVP